MSQAFKKCGHRSVPYDLLTGGHAEDLASKEGFHTLLLKALRLLPLALVVGGPPCSMFVFLSSSQHLRHRFPPYGNFLDEKTQLANCLVENTVFWQSWNMLVDFDGLSFFMFYF